MKILCEVRLNVTQFDRSQFRWLKGKENYLFTFEDEKRLRMLKIRQDDGLAQEIHTASVSESRYCSCISWNRDESLLALVVDRRLIYFWDVKRNHFSQFKVRAGETPKIKGNSSGRISNPTASQANRDAAQLGDIDLIAWSKISDKLAICYASAQILICQIAAAANVTANEAEKDGQEMYPTIWERFIGKSDSTLQRIVSIVVSDSAELFACFSITSEILIVSFDGQTKFYCPCENINLYNARFSPLAREYGARSGQYMGQALHLACQSGTKTGLYLTKIWLSRTHKMPDAEPGFYMPRDNMNELEHMKEARLISFYWLDSTHLLLCLESGSIRLMRIIRNSTKDDDDSCAFECTEFFKINASGSLFDSGLTTPISSTSSRPASRNLGPHDGSIETNSITSEPSTRPNLSSASGGKEKFKMFELIRVANKNSSFHQTFVLAAVTCYKLFYYELYELKNSEVQHQVGERFSFEHFDDIDLSDSLQRVNLELERVEWSQDCSFISLQVTSGHLLIYKTRLQNPMVVSYGSRTAFLSSADEVTILNYGTSSLTPYESSPITQSDRIASPCDTTSQTSVNSKPSPAATRAGDKAIILSVHLKPSLIAIGPRHLALALNNRVRLYPLNDNQSPQDTAKTGDPFQELEYLTIVTGISLSSHFVAIQFDDGRLKLHGIHLENYSGPRESIDNERFFPDPSQPELITAFTLTDKLLVFCTKSEINIFSLSDWIMVQTCNHSDALTGQIKRLRPNERGNQFICLIRAESNHSIRLENVALYDLYSNEIVSLIPRQEGNLWASLVERQIVTTIDMLTFDRSFARKIIQEHKLPTNDLGQLGESEVVDAIWDTDGRSLLLVGPKLYHVFAILCHTLSSEGPTCEYATSAKKPINYVTLYVSQGVVSYQTGLGRVINSILETHDEELKLKKLELQIQEIKDGLSPSGLIGNQDDSNQVETKHEALIDSEVSKEDQINSRLTRAALMEAHLRVTLLKVDYLCTILPIYPLTKCRDICKLIMEEESFNVDPDSPLICELVNEYKLINQIVFRLLAAWSLFTLNLNFASLIYKRNGLQVQANLIEDLLDDIKTRRMDSRFWVNRRILSILGMGDHVVNMAK